MSEAKEATAKRPVEPEFRAAQRWNIVWVVPVLALIIGGWLVYRHYSSRGPVARVSFQTAESVVAGVTEVRCRSVRVGRVSEVELSDDLKSVWVVLEMDPKNGGLLRAGSRFWVVRARVSGTDVSGLGTLLTGAYIEMEPGSGAEGAAVFQGLEEPPPTSLAVPGRRLVLKAERAGTLTVGSPVFHRGVEVGRIESRNLAANGEEVTYDVFIQQEFSPLVSRNTRFWNASGVEISAGASGVKLRAPSLAAILSGGAEFGVPPGLKSGGPLTEDGAVFTLFEDEEHARTSLFVADTRLLLMLNQSVLGLSPGAAVRFRGIHVGRVLEVSYEIAEGARDNRIPVLIEVDSAILCRGLQMTGQEGRDDLWRQVVAEGLRAALKSESLLVPTLYVDLDCYPNLPAVEPEHVGDYQVIPTVAAGLAQLEDTLTRLLAKLEALPLDATIEKIATAADETAATVAAGRETLDEINKTFASVRDVVADPALKSLPEDLRQAIARLDQALAGIGPDGRIQGDLLRTLDEMRASLRSIKALSGTIEEKPSSLIFGKDSSGNPTPRAPRGNR
ncbi:MAG: MlaD family protein [Akkermansiaceae bacterium]|jgi:paraquat-inducible protein B|nr:MlaD family protein [Akkermansiaceae bacterium]